MDPENSSQKLLRPQIVGVQGHRGGFQPENTLASFAQALDHGLDSIELDVWLTADNAIVVIHGSNDGNLSHHFPEENSFIYHKTLEDLQKFDLGQEQKIPTLESVFQLINKGLYINIELKIPEDPEIKKTYDFKLCVEKLYELIIKHDYKNHCCVSSFDFDGLEVLEKLIQEHQYHVDVTYIYNYYDSYELPEPDIYTAKGTGINISSMKLNQDVIKYCRERGKKVGIWVDVTVTQESVEFYHQLFEWGGIDYFCTNFPLVLKQVRSDWVAGIRSIDASKPIEVLNQEIIEQQLSRKTTSLTNISDEKKGSDDLLINATSEVSSTIDEVSNTIESQ